MELHLLISLKKAMNSMFGLTGAACEQARREMTGTDEARRGNGRGNFYHPGKCIKTDQDVNLKYYYLRRNDDPNDKIIKLPKGTDEGDCILDSSLNQECPSHIFMRRNQDGLVNITMSNVLKKFVGEYRVQAHYGG
ncbi:hypothetical protein OS493_019432 [Desmophyllum pertusum]|uniref:Uncharacterized protein n=1 Tax=Desmophyllum pertusum TaxID=174260 RepID=A0A9X0A1I1_9CNID|nr:hypothetical protein OS493_019432 [Desmophyllum pertusum]